MTICPHTGVTVPECSCSACIQSLIERHMPTDRSADTVEMPALDVRGMRRRRLTSRLRELRHRRAA